MRRRIVTLCYLILGVLGTIGGWYMFLMMFDLVPFPEYSLLSLAMLWCGLGTVLAAQLFAGPVIVWDIIKSYREDKGE